MTKEKISKKVFQEISKDDFRMKPRIFFVLISIWWLFLGFIFFLALVSAMILLSFLFEQLKIPFVIFNNPTNFIAYVPIVALVFIFIFCGLVFFFYRRSRACCRHENWLLFLVIILTAIILNLFFLRSDRIKSELVFLDRGNSNLGVMRFQEYWESPAKGTISGQVIFYYPHKNNILLVNAKGEKWSVDYADCKNKFLINKNDLVKIVGKKTGEYYFDAYYIW